jgi:hypothetical protein
VRGAQRSGHSAQDGADQRDASPLTPKPEQLTMRKLTLRDAEREIFLTHDFDAGNLAGFWEPDFAAYHVASYQTIIATFVDTKGWTVNTNKYSPTTTKHQTIVLRAIARTSKGG